MKRLGQILAIIVCIHLSFSSSYACSSFQLYAETPYHSKSYDWRFGDGMIIYNPAQLQKASLTLSGSQKKIQWVSQYSNLTFNQYGLDFPNGGMNEKGLTVEVLWLDYSVYPPADDKAVFNELQWIQYILDTQSTIEGSIKTLDTVRIDPIYAKVHYFVCDLKNCVTVEFVGGKSVIGTYEKTKFEVITNSTHKDSTDYLGKFKNFGGDKEIVWDNYNSLDRFARINEMLRIYQCNVDPITYSFSSLDTVKRKLHPTGSYTQWQIVHDKQQLKSYFKTTFGNTTLGNVSLSSFPKSCDTRYYFNLNNGTRGDVNDKFEPLTYEINYQHVNITLKKVMPTAPDNLVKAIAGAPFQFQCLN